MMQRYRLAACAEGHLPRRIALLLDGAMRFLHVAALAIEAGDLARKTRSVERALRIVGHLRATLDFERGGEIAEKYDALYVEVAGVALSASATLDAGGLRRAAGALGEVYAAWCEFVK